MELELDLELELGNECEMNTREKVQANNALI